MTNRRKVKFILGLGLSLLLTMGLACRLTSPTPAAWSDTSTSQPVITATIDLSQTQDPGVTNDDGKTPTEPPFPDDNTPTPKSTLPSDGPWLVYPAPDGEGVHVYDVESGDILEISLPEPLIMLDLTQGLSPDGHTLIVRAGLATNTDELALYKIDLPSTEVTPLTPLLSLSLQRLIVNEEDDRAFETLEAVTRPDGIAWSPDGRFLAFTAALDNDSSDLYVFDTERERIDRLNGLYSHSATPFWAPENNWLIFQELSYDDQGGWRSEVLSEISIPGYVNHNTLYVPPANSQEEGLLGWVNAQSLISYSQTVEVLSVLRQVNVETSEVSSIIGGSFVKAALDPESKALAYLLSEVDASSKGSMAGVYLRKSGRASADLLRGGVWEDLIWEDGGMFVAAGSQGVFAFTPEEESVALPKESHLALSPNGNWMVAWGEGNSAERGARLYQSPGGNLLQELTNQWVDKVFWGPDSINIFIQAEGSLYHLAFPRLELMAVEGDIPENVLMTFAWIE